MVKAAYYLYRFHHVRPSEFFKMSLGEKQVIMTFLAYEIAEKNKEYEEVAQAWRK